LISQELITLYSTNVKKTRKKLFTNLFTRFVFEWKFPKIVKKLIVLKNVYNKKDNIHFSVTSNEKIVSGPELKFKSK
jgi:hypothetical protein